jgi:hypothetical protein
MLRLVALLAVVGLTVYSVIDCARTDADQVTGLPKPMWLVAILLLPVIGPLAWLVAGRSRGSSSPPARRLPLAPDDDPDFLWQIERRRRQQATDDDLLSSLEDDLRPREDDEGEQRDRGDDATA